MTTYDRFSTSTRYRQPHIPPTRRRAWLAFLVELAPMLSLAAFALGPGLGAGLFLFSLLVSGAGWSLVGQPAVHLLVVASRLIISTPLVFVIVWAIAEVSGCRGGCEPFWLSLIALWVAYAVLAPIVSATALALRWWPRTTAEPIILATA